MGTLQDLRDEVAALAGAVKADVVARIWSRPPGTVPRRLSRSGSGLRAGGRPVRMAGTNAYWLALNDNVLDNGLPTYPSKATVNATLDAAVAMGINSVRVHTVGISLGKPRTIMPTLDVYDPVAFDAADYVIAAAKARGLFLSVPLTDRWDYYHGGAQSLVNMVMPSGSRQLYRFWSEPTVRAAFDRYVTTLLNHVNPYTGLRWGDDPTLAMWEIANEFYDLRNDTTSRDRHASAAALIKTLAPRALVVDGTGASGGRTADAPGLSDTNVDIVTAHYYNDHAMDTAWLPGDAASAAAASKVFLVGEYDWTDGGNGQADQNAAVTRAQWLAALETNPNIAGDYWWTLLVPAAGVHRDRYELYVPGENAEQTSGAADFTAHSAVLTAESSRVRNKGALLPFRPFVDFVGAGVAAVDDPAGGRTVVTVTGGFPDTFAEATTEDPAGQSAGAQNRQTIPAAAFTTVNLPVEVADPGNNFNPATSIYTVPTTGTYLVICKVRPQDNAPTAVNVGIGVHTSNADNAAFQWQTTSGTVTGGTRRQVFNYQRQSRFVAGDQLRIVAYSDGSTLPIAVVNFTIERQS